ncbi:MAG: hypothetical protein IKI50_08090 [Clostridia bacterium]|nr:hypothetical protein [Clostridia bacterium]
MKKALLLLQHLMNYMRGHILAIAAFCFGVTIVCCLVTILFVPAPYKACCSYSLSFAQENGKISTVPDDFNSSLVLAESFLCYMKEPCLLENAAEHLPAGLSRPYTAKDLDRAVSVELSKTSVCFRYSVLADNEQDALLLCRFYSQYSLKSVHDLTRLGFYSRTEAAYIDETYRPYSLPIIITYSMLSCLAAVILFSLLRITRRTRILSVEAIITRFPKLPVLGQVPEVIGISRRSIRAD